jgi:hypothetical protein
MTPPVNLNRFRKAKQKAEKAEKAAANRVKFGRTKAEKARDAEEASRTAAKMDGAKQEE